MAATPGPLRRTGGVMIAEMLWWLLAAMAGGAAVFGWWMDRRDDATAGHRVGSWHPAVLTPGPGRHRTAHYQGRHRPPFDVPDQGLAWAWQRLARQAS